uniref:Uncharacterized protein n=1 Tax=Cacopsylla melanoneura TaxID=428564 RepID=A0A8D8UQN0_9HEMI
MKDFKRVELVVPSWTRPRRVRRCRRLRVTAVLGTLRSRRNRVKRQRRNRPPRMRSWTWKTCPWRRRVKPWMLNLKPMLGRPKSNEKTKKDWRRQSKQRIMRRQNRQL